MKEFIPYIIFGITTGAIYGISAMGLVLTYKTSGVFNIGHGAVCAASAYVFYDLRQVHGFPWPVAGFISIFIFGPISGLILERLAVALAAVTTANKIVGTVGLLVAIRSGATLIFGDQAIVFNTFLPQSQAFAISGVTITYDSLITTLLGVAGAVALALFFRRTRLGTAMRGVVDDPQLLDMTGTAPTRVRRSAWVIGSCFASVSGVLFASNQVQLDINVLALLVVQAFGAATIARFASLPMCFVGGIIVGVLQKLVSKEVGSHANLQGIDLAVPFLVLFIGLLVIPRGKLVEVGRNVKALAEPSSSLNPNVRRFGYSAGIVVLLLIPHLWFVGAHLPAYNEAMSQAVLFISLHLLVRTSGQISLCHFGFAAIGACGFGHMLMHGVPFALAVLIGAAFCIPAALVVSIPAIRLSGLFLGLATLGFGITLSLYFYGKSYMFGFGQLNTRRPAGFGGNTAYYYLLLAVVAVVLAVVLVIERSRLGRLLRAMSDSPVALVMHGMSVNVARVLVFVISGFIAGIAGALYASLFGAVNQESFNPIQSLVALSVLAISGRKTVIAAFVAPALLYVVPNYISDVDLNAALQTAFGLVAILSAAASQGGVSKFFGSAAARFDERRRASPVADRFDPAQVDLSPMPSLPERSARRLDRLSVGSART